MHSLPRTEELNKAISRVPRIVGGLSANLTLLIKEEWPVIRSLMPNFLQQACHLLLGRYHDLRMRVVSIAPCKHV
jgi:hypothetical protein